MWCFAQAQAAKCCSKPPQAKGPYPAGNGNVSGGFCVLWNTENCRDAACSGSNGSDSGKRLTRSLRYACTPFLSAAKEREERMPPPNPPPSRHAGAADAKIHKLAGHNRPSSNSMNFGRAQRWPVGRRIRRKRAIQRTATSGRGVRNGDANSTVMPAAEPAPWEALAGMTMAQTMVQRCDSTVIPHLMWTIGAR